MSGQVFHNSIPLLRKNIVIEYIGKSVTIQDEKGFYYAKYKHAKFVNAINSATYKGKTNVMFKLATKYYPLTLKPNSLYAFNIYQVAIKSNNQVQEALEYSLSPFDKPTSSRYVLLNLLLSPRYKILIHQGNMTAYSVKREYNDDNKNMMNWVVMVLKKPLLVTVINLGSKIHFYQYKANETSNTNVLSLTLEQKENTMIDENIVDLSPLHLQDVKNVLTSNNFSNVEEIVQALQYLRLR